MARASFGIYGLVPVELMQDKAARAHICVYAALASFQGGSDECFPGYEKIAERAGCDRRTAIRGVKALLDAGWIAKLSTGGVQEGKNVSNRYRVLCNIVETVPATGEDMPEDAGGSVMDVTTPSVMDVTPVVSPLSPKKIIEKNIVKEDEEEAVNPSSITFEQWYQVIKPRAASRLHYLNPSSPLQEAFRNLEAAGLAERYEYLDELFDKYRDKPTGHLVKALQSLEDHPRELFKPDGQPAKPIEPRAVLACPVCGTAMSHVTEYDDLCSHCGYRSVDAEQLTTIKAAYEAQGLEGVAAFYDEADRVLSESISAIFKKTA